jgi:hypothetical protein
LFSNPYFSGGGWAIIPAVKRRELYRIVAEILPKAGGADGLLGKCAAAMKSGSVPKLLSPLGEILESDDALGEIYQAINAPALEKAYRATSLQRRKFMASEIAPVTQLFTPRWVVEFLLQNTLGRLWVQMHPDSRLGREWKWLVPGEYPAEKVKLAREIQICDPACGTMNFGLAAVDMLREIYREEMQRFGGQRLSRREIDASIVTWNLFGIDIDPRAIHLARQSLEIKTGCRAEHLYVADALFDSLPAADFDVVVTNPPYLSSRNLDGSIVARMKKQYHSAWRDACACFIVRANQLLREGGRAGILTMQSFMFTGGFTRLRGEIAESNVIETVAHFGPGLFDIGNPGTLQTMAMVFARGRDPDRKAAIFRLVDVEDKQRALQSAMDAPKSEIRFVLSQKDLNSFPRHAWMYWLSPSARRAFREFPALGKIAPPKQGLATTDNDRFVRFWWEVEPPGFSGTRKKWLPYAKGGRFRRWHESARHRVNWENDGREIKQAIVDRYPYLDGKWQWVAKNTAWYGKPGITYSYLTSGHFSARRLEEGTLFDVAGSSLFPSDPLPILGILNSSSVRRLLGAINPTVNFQVGDLRQLPIPPAYGQELSGKVADAIELTKRLDTFDEASPDFVQPAPWDKSASTVVKIQGQLGVIEDRIDRIVADLYGMKDGAHAGRAAAAAEPVELARRWISYAMGVWLGRFEAEAMGDAAVLNPLDRKLAVDLHTILARRAGAPASAEIEEMVGGLERFLSRHFIAWHNRLYVNRPVYWGFSVRGHTIVVNGMCTDAKILRSIGIAPPKNWHGRIDDGIAENLRPLSEYLAHAKLKKSLNGV